MKLLLEVKKIIIHCSASDHEDDDSLEAIRNLHISPKSTAIEWGKFKTGGKGFEAIGYHFVITKDGVNHVGRIEALQGAHTLGQNHDSIAICLTGDTKFSLAQFRTLLRVLDVLKHKYELKDSDIYGHYKYSSKQCPNFIV